MSEGHVRHSEVRFRLLRVQLDGFPQQIEALLRFTLCLMDFGCRGSTVAARKSNVFHGRQMLQRKITSVELALRAGQRISRWTKLSVSL